MWVLDDYWLGLVTGGVVPGGDPAVDRADHRRRRHDLAVPGRRSPPSARSPPPSWSTARRVGAGGHGASARVVAAVGRRRARRCRSSACPASTPALATLAFALMFEAVLVPLDWVSGGNGAAHGAPPADRPASTSRPTAPSCCSRASCLAIARASAVIAIRHGTTGRFLDAVRGSETAAPLDRHQPGPPAARRLRRRRRQSPASAAGCWPASPARPTTTRASCSSSAWSGSCS